jgi:hypothetical protein
MGLPQRRAVKGVKKDRPGSSALLHRAAEKSPVTAGLISGRINRIYVTFEKINCQNMVEINPTLKAGRFHFNGHRDC